MRSRRLQDRGRVRGFTLIELLAVLVIIGTVSALAIPVILPAINHRQVGEAASLLSGALSGARDRAIHDGKPSGFRLIEDPALPGSYNQIVPVGPAPDYSEGRATIHPGSYYASWITGGRPYLVLEQATTDPNGLPESPTSWMWNVRVGDRVQLEGAGPWYTVVGPLVVPFAGATIQDCGNPPSTYFVPNPEGFVNTGSLDCPSPLVINGIATEFLLLVNGRDDNGNGWVDEGWDGVDNNGNGKTDEPAEAEPESWPGFAATKDLSSLSYVIRRRPFPVSGTRGLALPSHVVIDSSRSRLPDASLSKVVEIMVQPDGTATASLPYGVPASLSMGSEFWHFAIVYRTDAGTGADPRNSWTVLTLQPRTGRIVTSDDPDPVHPFRDAMRGTR